MVKESINEPIRVSRVGVRSEKAGRKNFFSLLFSIDLHIVFGAVLNVFLPRFKQEELSERDLHDLSSRDLNDETDRDNLNEIFSVSSSKYQSCIFLLHN